MQYSSCTRDCHVPREQVINFFDYSSIFVVILGVTFSGKHWHFGQQLWLWSAGWNGFLMPLLFSPFRRLESTGFYILLLPAADLKWQERQKTCWMGRFPANKRLRWTPVWGPSILSFIGQPAQLLLVAQAYRKYSGIPPTLYCLAFTLEMCKMQIDLGSNLFADD